MGLLVEFFKGSCRSISFYLGVDIIIVRKVFPISWYNMNMHMFYCLSCFSPILESKSEGCPLEVFLNDGGYLVDSEPEVCDFFFGEVCKSGCLALWED
uniref:Uncharacterized protein n=1 Tax=Arcella intermedia TaxID=1963864 RepID=A0A6B2LRS1_9EUKA